MCVWVCLQTQYAEDHSLTVQNLSVSHYPFHVLTLICVYYTTLGVPEPAAKLGRIELTGELADPRTKVSVLSNAAWTIFQPDRQTVRL